jgi:hypothetical protein
MTNYMGSKPFVFIFLPLYLLHSTSIEQEISAKKVFPQTT